MAVFWQDNVLSILILFGSWLLSRMVVLFGYVCVRSGVIGILLFLRNSTEIYPTSGQVCLQHSEKEWFPGWYGRNILESTGSTTDDYQIMLVL